jgi:hypothetical protein
MDEDVPTDYLENLVIALQKTANSEVVLLIDEYDAPVTRNMGNQELALANAKVLHDFFAALKNPNIKENSRFTFVTGITRYALSSLDSGPNHLNDISLDPEYGGICGFTLEEFNSDFANGLEPTLEILKKTGRIKSSSTVADLIQEIYRWYDGYNWGGETRVLNPYSILNFFKKNEFDTYWAQSGRPGHLKAIIKSKRDDFIKLKLDPYVSDQIRNPDLTVL